MKDLNPEMIQQFVSASVVSPKTTKNICITLQSMWTTARAWGYVAHDLMEGVVLPEVKRVQRFFLSQLEIQLILAKAQGAASNVVWISGGNWAASRRAVRTDGG